MIKLTRSINQYKHFNKNLLIQEYITEIFIIGSCLSLFSEWSKNQIGGFLDNEKIVLNS
jgi:hypothetical protein